MTTFTRRRFLQAAAAACAAAPAAAALARNAPPRRPNIVFILADDLGWMDTAVYGSRYYQTPNIDRLASRGTRFTNAYAANPLCSPTRSSIMTGKYPGRLRLTVPAGHMPPEPDSLPWLGDSAPPSHKVRTPRSRHFMPLEEHTLAEALKDAGYATAFIGKWHLGHQDYWPKRQGFDVNIAGGHYPGPPSYFSPYRIQTLTDGPKGEYLADRLTDEAVRYLQQRKGNDQPFFLCLWHYSVHAPFQARADLVEPYRSRKDPRGKQNCPTMGGMVASLDASVGRVLDELDKLHLADDTVIVFTSDNGGNMYNQVDGTTPTNNAPLRNGKGNLYEGGVREPAVVIWPGVTRPGSVCDEPISSIDYYPTLLEIAGAKTQPGQIVDGESITPVLRGQGRMHRREIYCYFPHYIPATGNYPGVSVRQGDWKLYRFFGEGPDRTDKHELYNLKDDLSETTDLAARMPDKVRELDALLSAHLKAIDAIIPAPNPAYDAKSPDPMKGEAPPRPKPVKGWLPAGTCTLQASEGILVVNSTGGDPHLHTTAVGQAAGPAVAKVRMRLAGRGQGQFYWITPAKPNYARERTVFFDLQHDNQWHEYQAKLPVRGKITGLRLDPGSAPGRIEIQWIRLEKEDGTLLREWKF